MTVASDRRPGHDEAGHDGPAPSVLSPAAALGVLLSRALSSGQAQRRYRKRPDEARPHRDCPKSEQPWGQSPHQKDPDGATPRTEGFFPKKQEPVSQTR